MPPASHTPGVQLHTLPPALPLGTLPGWDLTPATGSPVTWGPPAPGVSGPAPPGGDLTPATGSGVNSGHPGFYIPAPSTVELLPSGILHHGPLLQGRHSPLTPEEVLRILTEPNNYTDNVADFANAKGGEVYLFICKDPIEVKDWKKSGYIMTSMKGKDIIHSKENPTIKIFKRTYNLVTNEMKKGDKRFKRFAWQLEEKSTRSILVQFVGDESLAGPVFHGNSKTMQPRVQLLPSVAHKIRQTEGSKTPAVIYEEMRLNAGPSRLEQNLFSPSSKGQVKNLQKNDRSRRREATGTKDPMETLLRTSFEGDDVKLLIFKPRLIVVGFIEFLIKCFTNILPRPCVTQRWSHLPGTCSAV